MILALTILALSLLIATVGTLLITRAIDYGFRRFGGTHMYTTETDALYLEPSTDQLADELDNTDIYNEDLEDDMTVASGAEDGGDWYLGSPQADVDLAHFKIEIENQLLELIDQYLALGGTEEDVQNMLKED